MSKNWQEEMDRAARRIVSDRINKIVATYDRDRDLPTLQIDPNQDRLTVIAQLQNKLRASKHSVESGHYSALSPMKLMLLRGALRAEWRAL